jgi:metallo-beta-lactamase class B
MLPVYDVAMKLLAALLVSVLALAQGTPALRPDPPHKCAECDGWNKPHEPFKIFGNTYYVGVEGIASVLITSGAGSILLDGALPQSAPLIDANIRNLGFRTQDIRLILNSHAHYDHAGGIAALQRVSGATVAARAAGKAAIERGEPTPDDPQFAFGRDANAYPAVANVKTVADGETLRVGDLAITAHAVPGHTPGATTWTWRSCEGARCWNIVYADSLNSVSAPGFRFSGDASHPSIVEQFRRSIALVRDLPCDIVIPVHPVFPLTPNGCRAYADGAAKRLDDRIAEEKRGGLVLLNSKESKASKKGRR